MLPVFLDLKVVKFYTFGVFLLLAFFWGCYLLWKNFLLTAYKEEDIFDGMFLALTGGLFMSRLLYVVLHFNEFGFSILKFILINGYPGLSLYGFLIGFFFTLFFYTSRKKMKTMEVFDYFIPPAFLALGFGKIGSFFSGTELSGRLNHFLLTLFPLYEAVLFFLAAFFSYKILFSIRREKYEKGFNLFFFGLYFSFVSLMFGVIRSGKNLLQQPEFNIFLSSIFVLTFSFYFIYYFRSLIFERIANITRGVRRHGKKHSKTTHQKT